MERALEVIEPRSLVTVKEPSEERSPSGQDVTDLEVGLGAAGAHDTHERHTWFYSKCTLFTAGITRGRALWILDASVIIPESQGALPHKTNSVIPNCVF